MKNVLKTPSQRFSCDDDCYKFMAEIKWPDERFVCRRCGNTTYHHGRSPYSRRCNKCKHDESVTSGTMLDKLKFPILTAFNIISCLATRDTGISSSKLAGNFGIQPKSYLAFRYKVQQAISLIEQKPLIDAVGLGVFSMESIEYDNWCKRERPKQRIAVAAEIKGTTVNRAFAWVMEEDTAHYLSPFVKRFIHPQAHIFMIERYGFKQLQREHKLMTFVHDVPLLSEYFRSLRKGILSDTYCLTYDHLQGYLDEYHFRLNSRRNSYRNFDRVIKVMMQVKKEINK